MDGDMAQVYGHLVSTPAELAATYAALEDGPGGTILLAGGRAFTFQAFDGAGDVSAPVTIRSHDPANPATITDLRLNGIENLTVAGVQFHRGDVGESWDDALLRITASQNITIRDSLATSDATGPLGTVAGHARAAQMAIVRDSTGITFEGNTLRDLRHGLTFMDSFDVTVQGNDISRLQGDGIRIAGVSGMLVQGNHIHDLLGATWETNHADMIQIWGTGITVNNESLTIRGNLLDTGAGAVAQMIFGHNEEFAENGRVFQDIVIEDNLLFGAHSHAISLNHVDGVTVRHNTVLQNPDTYHVRADGTTAVSAQLGRIAVTGTDVRIEHNIAPRIEGLIEGGDDSNVLLSPAGAKAHVVNLEAGGSGDLRDLALRPDSPLNGTVGSRLGWSEATAPRLLAVADVTHAPQDRSVVTLDAGLSRGPDGLAQDTGATFLWRFGDGATAEGPAVTHDFLRAGVHGYSLTVTLPDGRTDQITRQITIEDPLALHLTPDAWGNGPARLLDGPQVSDGWIGIGGRARVEIGREIDALFDRDAFNIGLTFAAKPGAAGMLLQLPETLTAEIDGRGRLTATLTTDAGAFTVTSPRPLFVEAERHALNLLYDGGAETLTLMIDGVAEASVAAQGTTAPVRHWGLTLGATWHEGVAARIAELYLLTEAIPLAEAMPPLAPPFVAPDGGGGGQSGGLGGGVFPSPALPALSLPDLGGAVDDFS